MKLLNIKILIILMFLSGLLQWSVLDIPWEYLTLISVVHALISLIATIFLIIPFVNSHAYNYIVIKKVNSLNGWILGFVLLLITISGFYLFFIGNTGGDLLGFISFNVHLYGSFMLIILFIYHIRPKENTYQSMATAIMMVLLLSLLNPTTAYSASVNKLSDLKLEGDLQSYHIEDWTNSSKCKTCHTEIFNQWADSNHKNMVESNPYYMVMEGIAAEVEGEDFRKWCMSCHNPTALTTGRDKTSHAMNENLLENKLYEKGAKSLIDDFKTHGTARLEEGVSCVTCHRIVDVKKEGNASYELDLTNRKQYPFEDSNPGISLYLGEKFINAKPTVHKESYMKPIYKKSEYCASCHDETSPITGKRIVSTYQEWEKSPFNNPKDKTKHKTCIDCHMTNYEKGKRTPLKGISTNGGKIKEDVKVHYFAGSNHFLSGLKSQKHEDQTLQLLRSSAELDVDIKEDNIFVGVKNVGAGHHLPTGVADFRELWLDITLKDANGKTVFSSGKLKEDGDLNYTDARPFMKVFGDENGSPVGLLFWKYKTLISDSRIPAGKRRVERYSISQKDLTYPLNAEVKLNFRIYPQWVTTAVQKAFPELTNPPVVTLQTLKKEFLK